MAILLIADASDDMLAHYDQVIEQIEAAGHGQPSGRQFHVAARKVVPMARGSSSRRSCRSPPACG